MKRHCFSSLREFYADCEINRTQSIEWKAQKIRDKVSFIGLSYPDVLKYKFSYPIGVEKLRHFKEVNIEKDTRIKLYNQFDGYDINIDRMYENLDFLIDERRVKNRPKTIDIYINIGEAFTVDYDNMLNKTYAATKIVDYLETMGVRCAVYAVISFKPIYSKRTYGKQEIIEICLKNHADTLNMGAVCAGISPWMLRYWGILWIAGNCKGSKIKCGAAIACTIPDEEKTGIVIDTQQCLNIADANKLIENIKVA